MQPGGIGNDECVQVLDEFWNLPDAIDLSSIVFGGWTKEDHTLSKLVYLKRGHTLIPYELWSPRIPPIMTPIAVPYIIPNKTTFKEFRVWLTLLQYLQKKYYSPELRCQNRLNLYLGCCAHLVTVYGSGHIRDALFFLCQKHIYVYYTYTYNHTVDLWHRA